MKDDRPYVLIRHKSGRSFTMNRNYVIINPDFMSDGPKSWVDDWEGWLPMYDSQRPKWIENLNEKEFVAFWLYKD